MKLPRIVKVLREERNPFFFSFLLADNRKMHVPADQLMRLWNSEVDLAEAALAKLKGCQDCKDAALMPGEYCSDECVALVAALIKAGALEGK